VVALPYARINRGPKLTKAVIARGVVIPQGLVVGEGAARRFRRTDAGFCLTTQPMLVSWSVRWEVAGEIQHAQLLLRFVSPHPRPTLLHPKRPWRVAAFVTTQSRRQLAPGRSPTTSSLRALPF
jgi:hypothetical protein